MLFEVRSTSSGFFSEWYVASTLSLKKDKAICQYSFNGSGDKHWYSRRKFNPRQKTSKILTGHAVVSSMTFFLIHSFPTYTGIVYSPAYCWTILECTVYKSAYLLFCIRQFILQVRMVETSTHPVRLILKSFF